MSNINRKESDQGLTPEEAKARWSDIGKQGGKTAGVNLLDRCRAVVDPDGTRTDKDREECAQQLKTAYYRAKGACRKVSEIGLDGLWAEECAK